MRSFLHVLNKLRLLKGFTHIYFGYVSPSYTLKHPNQNVTETRIRSWQTHFFINELRQLFGSWNHPRQFFFLINAPTANSFVQEQGHDKFVCAIIGTWQIYAINNGAMTNLSVQDRHHGKSFVPETTAALTRAAENVLNWEYKNLTMKVYTECILNSEVRPALKVTKHMWVCNN
jgi:hypothetical protein